jgi:hypothetical protein
MRPGTIQLLLRIQILKKPTNHRGPDNKITIHRKKTTPMKHTSNKKRSKNNTKNKNKITIIYREEFEDATGIIRIRKSKDRQHNGQKKKYKRTNNDLQSIHIKLKTEYHEPH